MQLDEPLLLRVVKQVGMGSVHAQPTSPVGKGSVTESQNHGMVGVGRDLCGSSSPTSLLKQDHLEQAAPCPGGS